MYPEPRFDDPSRTADYGFFANERLKPVATTGKCLANAILTGVEPIGAPFSEWVPKLVEGWRFQPIDNGDTILIFKSMLSVDDPCVVRHAMDILNDVAYENYGGEA